MSSIIWIVDLVDSHMLNAERRREKLIPNLSQIKFGINLGNMVKRAGARLTIFVAALLMITTACSSVADIIRVETSPTATAVRNVLATRIIPSATAISPVVSTPMPSAVPMSTGVPIYTAPAPLPTAVEPATEPANGFCCLRFAGGPFAEDSDTFSAGTEIIYAIWDYAGMAPDDQIRRIWIRDDLIWLPREEKWDWEKYGADGTVRDLSIFDFEGEGLQSGSYRLQLYLNDTLQEEAAFVILPP
jgi:hypothetical protein